jgi:hypothetical protein
MGRLVLAVAGLLLLGFVVLIGVFAFTTPAPDTKTVEQVIPNDRLGV